MESTATQLEARFSEAVTIKGTQKQHHFKPLLNGFMEIAELTSDAAQRTSAKIRKTAVVAEPLIENDGSEQSIDYVGNYVVVKYSSKMWVGFVDQKDEEFGDFHIKFLHPSGKNSYAFPPNQREQCFMNNEDIVGILPEPTLNPGTRICYTFLKERLQALMTVLH